MYEFLLDNWWKHQGIDDRFQTSGIDVCEDYGEYLTITDDWWYSLTYYDKMNIYERFFSED